MWQKSSGNLPKIIIISGKNPLSEGGGYGSYAYSLAKTITSLGVACQIFCVGQADQMINSRVGQIRVVGSKLLSLPIFRGNEMAGLPILAIKLTLIIKNQIETNKTTLVWGVGPWALAGAFLKLFPSQKNVILLAHYATSFKHEFLGTLAALRIKDYGLIVKLKAIIVYWTIIQLYTLLEKFLLTKTDQIITHYSSTEKILSGQYGIKSSKFCRLPYCVDLIKKTSPGHLHFKIKKPLILLICRQDPRKGINFLLHALLILQKKGLKFSALVIGGGKMLEQNRALAKKLHLTNTNLAGFVADPKPFLKKANLYVFPSVEEGNSAFSILEAMQARLPIVSTNVDGIPEDLVNNQSAILVPPKNPLALADAMQRLIENPELAKRLGLQAKKSFEEKHSKIKVLRALNTFLSMQED